MNRAQTLKKIEELKRLKHEKLLLIDNYRRENLIEFFTTQSMPANPLQKELIEAWLEPRNKVFTYTGANRIGKTTIGAIIAFATMIGEWPWDHTRLPFKHAEPRKVRYVGQDWEKHVNQVLQPALKKWWPKVRKVKIKKNTLGVDAFFFGRRPQVLRSPSHEQQAAQVPAVAYRI